MCFFLVIEVFLKELGQHILLIVDPVVEELDEDKGERQSTQPVA
jgi:hypothetical protein